LQKQIQIPCDYYDKQFIAKTDIDSMLDPNDTRDPTFLTLHPVPLKALAMKKITTKTSLTLVQHFTANDEYSSSATVSYIL
jgi:hypothetical protein